MKPIKNKIACIMAIMVIFNLSGCTAHPHRKDSPTQNETTVSSSVVADSLQQDSSKLQLGLGKQNTDSKLSESPISLTENLSYDSTNNVSLSHSMMKYLEGSNAQVLSATDELALKEAITVVKSRIDIPEKFTEFTYELNNQYDSTAFSLIWSTEDDNKEFIIVNVVGNIIVNISDSTVKNEHTQNPSFSKLGIDELINLSKSYFKMINPQLNSEVRYEVSSLNLYSSEAIVSFKRYENGIYVTDNGGQIVLNKDTGELSSFNLTWWDVSDLGDISGMKSNKEVKNSFKKICTLTPYYKISYDYEKKEHSTSLIYRPSSTDEIDAFTGQWSSIWEDMSMNNGHRYYGIAMPYFSTNDMGVTMESADDMVMGDKEVIFTEAELEKIEINDSLLKGEDIKDILINNEIIKLPSSCSVMSYDVYSSKDKNGNEEFFATVSIKTDDSEYDNVSAKVNAQTGEIISYNRYINNNNNKTILDVASANDLAEKAREVLAPNFYQEYRPSEDNNNEAWISEDKDYFETERTLCYSRYINDIEVLNESMNIRVDSLGNVLGYNYDRTDVEFIEPNLLSVDDAFDKLYEQMDFDLYYDCWVSEKGEINPYLIYKIDNFTLDAITGDLVNNWNYYDNDDVELRTIEYTDIEGLSQYEKIKELQKYGILLSVTDEFKPNLVVTDKEFDSVLGTVLNSRRYNRHITSASSGSDDEEVKSLTNKLAAAIYTKFYDSNDLAYIPGIFKSPFNDVPDTDEYVGCFAIANAKNFLVADENNNIKPDKELTRAEVIDILYDYILSLQNSNS